MIANPQVSFTAAQTNPKNQMRNKLTEKFAWLPMRRWVKDGKRTFTTKGWYWLRTVKVMRAGLLQEWTAYAHYNDREKKTG